MDLESLPARSWTFCIYCHTALPYALARDPVCAARWRKNRRSGNEQRMVDNVRKRVRMWSEVEPFSIRAIRSLPNRAGRKLFLNALILANADAALSDDTKLAFLLNMWALQQPNGALNWLDFHNAPWESGDSQFLWQRSGRCRSAVGTAPGNYSSTPAIQDNLKHLRDYLTTERRQAVAGEPRRTALASTKLPGLLTASQQDAIVAEALANKPTTGRSLTSIVGTMEASADAAAMKRAAKQCDGLITSMCFSRQDFPVNSEVTAWSGMVGAVIKRNRRKLAWIFT